MQLDLDFMQSLQRHASVVVAAAALCGFVESAYGDVDWEIEGTTAPGNPTLLGTMTTADIPVTCVFVPPASCTSLISGTLTIPSGTLGGPGTTIDLAVDPLFVLVSIANSPLGPSDDFNFIGVAKDGYTCDASAFRTVQCAFAGESKFWTFSLTEQKPSVSIGGGGIKLAPLDVTSGRGDPGTIFTTPGVQIVPDAGCSSTNRGEIRLGVIEGVDDVDPGEGAVNVDALCVCARKTSSDGTSYRWNCFNQSAN